jgi:hypothetical protein
MRLDLTKYSSEPCDIERLQLRRLVMDEFRKDCRPREIPSLTSSIGEGIVRHFDNAFPIETDEGLPS